MIQKQIDDYKGLLDQSNTLWWAYDQQDKNGNGTGKLHYYYQGQEVDSKTLKPTPTQSLLNPAQQYKLSNGK